METTEVHHGMIIMYSGVMDTVFHSGDEWDSMPQNWVLKYPPFFVQNRLMISVCDLLVQFCNFSLTLSILCHC